MDSVSSCHRLFSVEVRRIVLVYVHGDIRLLVNYYVYPLTAEWHPQNKSTDMKIVLSVLYCMCTIKSKMKISFGKYTRMHACIA